MRYQSVLFDMDGTLVDNSEGIFNAARYALEQLGRMDELHKVTRDFIGPPLRLTFQQCFGMDEAQVEEAVRVYRVFYRATGVYQCSPYPGVEDMLRRLHEAGATIILATSKAQVFAETILDHTGLGRYFSAIVGSELSGARDNKREIIEHIQTTLLCDARLPAVMVGDRDLDAKGALEAGMDALAALWGFGTAQEFAPYQNVRATFAEAAGMADWLMEEV